MSDDLRTLLRQAARGPADPGFDPATIAGRARRRHRMVVAAVTVLCVVVVSGGAAWYGSVTGPTVPAVDQVPPRPSVTASPSPAASASPTPSPSPTDRPDGATAGDVGPAMSIEDVGTVASHGVAVETATGVVLVTLDGTVAGHLPDASIVAGGPAARAPGPVPLATDAAPVTWLDPSRGGRSESLLPPMPASHRLSRPTAGPDPGEIILRAGRGETAETVATFSAQANWHLSAGHRVLSWQQCPEGVTPDRSSCTAAGWDTDMGGAVELQPGCWVSDGFADFNLLVVCETPAEPPHLEVFGPGKDGPDRIDLPTYPGQPADVGHIGLYRNAFFAGPAIVATWSAECEIPIPVIIDGNTQPRPLLGDDLSTSPAAFVLGVAPNGQAVVHVLGTPACGNPATGGIFLVNPTSGDLTPLFVADDITHAKMWAPGTSPV